MIGVNSVELTASQKRRLFKEYNRTRLLLIESIPKIKDKTKLVELIIRLGEHNNQLCLLEFAEDTPTCDIDRISCDFMYDILGMYHEIRIATQK